MKIIDNSNFDLEYEEEYEKVNDGDFNKNNFYSVVKSFNKLKTKLKKLVEKNNHLIDELEIIKGTNIEFIQT
jgi:hypothetical protein